MVKNTNYEPYCLGLNPVSATYLLVITNKDKFIIIVEDFNTFFLLVDSTSSHKIIKNLKNLNKMIYKLNLADIQDT